jgi:hypothetical protein
MVIAVRRKVPLREVARRFGVVLGTVQYWVARARGKRLDRVDWHDRSRRPRRTQRTSARLERRIVTLRRQLHKSSALGECGALAIRRALLEHGLKRPPSIRTIGRILARHGLLDGRRRIRRPPPPTGWYLPPLARRAVELDSCDVVEGLKIKSGPLVDVFNAISLHGGLAESWPATKITARFVVTALVQHWRKVGLPHYAQFDNDTRFQGPHQHPDTVGRVTRLCLSLGVTPVFAPPRETGFQASIESFNGRWQAKVWARFTHASLTGLRQHSVDYIAATRSRSAPRIEAAPTRRPFPKGWKLDLQATPRGRIVYIRRTDDRGRVSLLGHTFTVDANWPHRLVRAEFDLDHHKIRFYALRRREPTEQPCLKTITHRLPKRSFHE